MKTTAKIVVAAGILSWLIWGGQLDLSKLSRIHHWDLPRLAGGMLMMLTAMALPVWRWRMLAQVQGFELKLGMAAKVSWLGYYASLILPGGTGGDLAKAYIIIPRSGGGRTRAVSTVLVDRVMGLYSLITLGAIGSVSLLLSDAPMKVKASCWMATGLFLAMSLGAAIAASRRTSGLLIRVLPESVGSSLRDSLDRYRDSTGAMIRIFAISLVGSSALITSYAMTARAMGNDLDAVRSALVFPLVVVANAIPLTPNGLGVGETVGSRLFNWIGMDDGALVVLVVRLISIGFSLPGALTMFGVKQRGLQNIQAEQPPAEPGV